jgi:hypothetical protein
VLASAVALRVAHLVQLGFRGWLKVVRHGFHSQFGFAASDNYDWWKDDSL